MSTSRFPDFVFLNNRAEQCRSLARTFRDPIVRDRMLGLAVEYEELAKFATSLDVQHIKVQKLD